MQNEKKELFLLGSGESINRLTAEERAYIDACPVKIAQNKFTAFYKKAGIVPTHVFFIDYFSYTSIDVFQYILDLCVEDGLLDMKFVVNEGMRKFFFRRKGLFYSLLKHNPLSIYKGFPYRPYYHLKHPFDFTFLKMTDFLLDGPWASSLDQDIFHFRSSLTTLLNYISIVFPNYSIKMVGTDLNSKGYFFEEEYKALNLESEDWTSTHTQKNKVHFTAVNFKGTNMLDKFPFMVEELNKTGNPIFSCNPESLLVEKGLVPVKGVMEQ